MEEHLQHHALRRQKDPGVLKAPEVQGSLVAPLRPGSGAAPGLALPSFAGASGEAMDASSLAVLLQFSLAAQKKEEEALKKAKEAEEAKEKEERKAKLEVSWPSTVVSATVPPLLLRKQRGGAGRASSAAPP